MAKLGRIKDTRAYKPRSITAVNAWARHGQHHVTRTHWYDVEDDLEMEEAQAVIDGLEEADES